MKRFATLAALIAITLGITAARAEDSTNALPTISALQATNYFNKQVIVTGIVAQVSSRPAMTFINFDKRYPDSPFAAVIRSKNTNAFENLPALKGKAVSVEGRIKEYNGKPEMELTKQSQIKLLSEAK